jgi:hypothetical protein
MTINNLNKIYFTYLDELHGHNVSMDDLGI